MERDVSSQQDLFPMFFKLAKDGTYAVFVNQEITLHDNCRASRNNIRLVFQQGTGIWDNFRKQQSVGGSTFTADNPANAQSHQFPILFYRPAVAAIKSHPGGFAAAGAGKLMELESGNNFVIFFL